MDHYDVLPYESNPFRETHPQFLAALGRLLKVPAADPKACRVLELGCAGGGNLIPMAWQLPGSEFVGIDLEERQIRDGQALVEELGLANIRLSQGDILELGEELGRFDYIVAHGVYSWIPAPVREATMSLCRRLLQPNGIAYISFNTRPGWRVRGMLREILLYHVRGVEDPVARLNKAGEMIELLCATLADQPQPLSKHLALEANYLRTAHPSYVYHEYLEAFNEPVLISEFLDQAQRHGLRFLGEAQLYTMFASSLGPQVEAFLDRFEDQPIHEQYLDMLTQRTFRQTLLCHGEVTPEYDIDLSLLDQFACYANLQPPEKLDLRRPHAQAFLTVTGTGIAVSEPLAKALVQILSQVYPDAIALPELLEAARQAVGLAHGKKSAPEEETSAWRGEVFNLYANGLLGLNVEPVVHRTDLGARPALNPLAKAQVRRGSRNLTTVWHETLNTDVFSLHLARYLDGTRDRQALIDQLLADVADGSLSLPELARGSQQRRQSIAANVDRMLALFARNGVLAPGS